MYGIKEGLKRFDRIMAAITFAESGERETALDLMHRRPEKKKGSKTRIKRWDKARPGIRI